jgi:hypothetical protein
MKSKILGLLLLVAGLSALTMPGQSQKNSEVAKEVIHKQRELPIVDFPEKGSTLESLSSKQKVKGSRYDRQSSEPIREAYMISGRTWSTDWSKGLPALPFKQSDVVLIGGVLHSNAHLSNDKTGIYSEFEVQVEEILKDLNGTVKDSISAGSTVCVERFGGAVRFPSGGIQKYETTGQGMPVVGQRYVFFLKRINETDFSIVTGYQLDGQIVSPLDGAVVEEGKGVYPFDVYQGSDVSTFLQTVRTHAKQRPKG